MQKVPGSTILHFPERFFICEVEDRVDGEEILIDHAICARLANQACI
jgi:hypothetical protein